MLQLSPLNRRSTAFVEVYLLLLIGMIAVTRSPAFSVRPVLLGGAILFDLITWPTLLFYGLIARSAKLPIIRLAVAVLVFARIALFILPPTARPFSINLPVLLAVLEGVTITFAILRVRAIQLKYRELRRVHDATTALTGSLEAVLGSSVSALILSEWQTFRWGLLGWWRVEPAAPGQQILTTHRQSGEVAMGVALLVVGLIEGVAVHLLLARWSPSAAVWVSVFSAYGMLFLLADLVASCQRPSYATDHTVHLRLGIRWQVVIPKTLILRVLPIQEKPAKAPDLLRGTLLVTPNTLLILQEPVAASGPYGIRRNVSRIALFLDDGAPILERHPGQI